MKTSSALSSFHFWNTPNKPKISSEEDIIDEEGDENIVLNSLKKESLHTHSTRSPFGWAPPTPEQVVRGRKVKLEMWKKMLPRIPEGYELFTSSSHGSPVSSGNSSLTRNKSSSSINHRPYQEPDQKLVAGQKKKLQDMMKEEINSSVSKPFKGLTQSKLQSYQTRLVRKNPYPNG